MNRFVVVSTQENNTQVRSQLRSMGISTAVQATDCILKCIIKILVVCNEEQTALLKNSDLIVRDL